MKCVFYSNDNTAWGSGKWSRDSLPVLGGHVPKELSKSEDGKETFITLGLSPRKARGIESGPLKFSTCWKPRSSGR